ncbi:hypothetical protein CVV38_02105 [Candidatus Peregrinibacteria bacterium HGW-Peregrinibacteria-1]|jgi:Fe2+ or Zn2+ uptake regulation protein|nr:MAG: hypothetical protein CVV38_02105 [Candidatus Peregrinibacteria bacterium HGW-Peregrinibacteria-1]
MSFVEYIEKELKERGYRFTRPRKVVAEALGNTKKALSAYEIEKVLKLSAEKVDIVTIYRILEVYKELNLIHESRDGYMACSHMECETKSHCHHQIVCDNCHQVTELHLEECGLVERVRSSFPKLIIKSHYVEITGVCEKCLGDTATI